MSELTPTFFSSFGGDNLVAISVNEAKARRNFLKQLKNLQVDYTRALSPSAIKLSLDTYRQLRLLGVVPRNSETAKLNRLCETHSETFAEYIHQYCQTLGNNTDLARVDLKDYAGLETLDEHQISAVALASKPEITGLCIFDEQGLGKTVEALFAADRLFETSNISRVLVFAPKNMVLEWKQDAIKFFGEKYKYQTITGSKTDKIEALDSKADFYITNFETAKSHEARLKQLVASSIDGTLLIVDESFYLKNPGSRRTIAVQNVRDAAKRCLVLCGTPAPNSAKDIVEQFNLADQGSTFGAVDLPSDPEEQRDFISNRLKTHGCYIRRTKAEYMPHLPGRTFTTIKVNLNKNQRVLYNKFRDNLIADLEAISEPEFKSQTMGFLARRNKLLQICSCPQLKNGTENEYGAKSDALEKLLRKLIEVKKEKVVVWSFYTASIEGSMKRFAKYNPLRIDGKVTSDLERRKSVESFQNDPDAMLLIANPAAAGAGLTLHSARYAIYESHSNQAAHYFQSLDRIHRRGQKRPVEYFLLECDNTIESMELARLERKKTNASDLLGDINETVVTREQMLSELS